VPIQASCLLRDSGVSSLEQRFVLDLQRRPRQCTFVDCFFLETCFS